MKVQLAGKDINLVREIISLGRSGEAERSKFEAERLRALVAECSKSLEINLQKLSRHAGAISLDMPTAQLTSIVIAFERLLGWSVDDSDIKVATQDKRGPAPVCSAQQYDSFAGEGGGVPFYSAPGKTSEGKLNRSPHKKLVLLADNIRSAFNVGALFRTAECFGIDGITLVGYTPTPEHPSVAKTCMGTESLVRWEQARDASAAIGDWKAKGYRVVALETAETAEPLEAFYWPDKAVLWVGNERFGLSPSELQQADNIIRIPMYGVKNSLNVGIATGIALQSWARQLHHVKPIGVVTNSLNSPSSQPRQGVLNSEVSVIELHAGQNFEQALEDLSGFERVWLISDMHLVRNWKTKVLPPSGSDTKRGVFATRSPHRPNPIGLTAARLQKVEGRKIWVSECDLLNGTPIYDIKPYLPYADAFPDAQVGWSAQSLSGQYDIEYEADTRSVIDKHPELAAAVLTQLSVNPLRTENRRIKELSENHFELAFRYWRVRYKTEPSKVRISQIHQVSPETTQ